MNFTSYTKIFKEKSTNSGYSEDNIIKCLKYAEILFSNQVPVIYNLTHLSRLVGIERNYVVQAAVVSKHSDAYYRFYNVKKKKGKGYRQIMEPLPNLKLIQYWILQNILEKIKPSSYAKAYVKKRGLKQNVRFHVNQPKVFSIDIEDFFPSIKFEDVERIFFNVGYSKEVSNYLAKLCCLKERLPQGAPTSPYLSNLILQDIDNEIAKYCKNNDIRFTRYADDLTFSGEFDENDIYNLVESNLKKKGFEINKAKTKLMLNSQRQIVTGVVVNDKIQLDKETRKQLRTDIYFIKKKGLESHMKYKGINGNFYLNYLIGKVSFGLYLNPEDKRLKEYHSILTNIYKEGTTS